MECENSIFAQIEQWGTGFQKVHNLLNDYPELELKLAEPGLSFQVQFAKRNRLESNDKLEVEAQANPELRTNTHQAITRLSPSNHQAITKLSPGEEIVRILGLLETPKKMVEIMTELNYSDRTYFRQNYLDKLIGENLVRLTIPDKPTSPKQRYVATEEGKQLVKELYHEKSQF